MFLDVCKYKILVTSMCLTLFPMASLAQLVIEEIVVTAQKRDERLQEVPITISAFTADDLETAGVLSTDDIGNITPGLQWSRQLAGATVFMRGVGTNGVGAGAEGNVSVYIDGIYQAEQVNAVTAFNNIERVEVLKGPQGTLFGRNTTGGLINIITKDPTEEVQLKVGLSAGNYDTYKGDFYLSGGLSETVAADLAVSVKRQGGRFGDAPFLDKGVGFDEFTMYRSKLVYTPSDDTTVKLTASYSESEGDLGIAWHCLSTLGCFGGTVRNRDDNIQDFTGDFTPGKDTESFETSLRFEHSFDSIDFVSVTSFNSSESLQTLDQDIIPALLAHVEVSQSSETFTQEFQLLSGGGSALQWIAGLYYFNVKADRDPLGFTVFSPDFNAVVSQDIFVGLDTESIAVFAQAAYDFTEKTTLTAGLRWTQDDREIAGNNFFNGANILSYEDDDSWNEPTWRLAIDHQLNDDVLFFASYNRGFKSGNYDTVTTAGLAPAVDPEILDAYELGMKAEFLDNRLRLNMALFYYDYDGLQLFNTTTSDVGGVQVTNSVLANAVAAEIFGAEAEGQFLATENLALRFGISVLDSEYTDFPNCTLSTPQLGDLDVQGDCSGNNLIVAPELTYNIGGEYRIPSSVGQFSISTTLVYNDGFFWQPGNRTSQEEYTLVNAELGWASTDDKYRVRLFGRNLTDEIYDTYAIEQETFGDIGTSGPPRTYGVAFEMQAF